jgi:translation elongation factor EF-Tu-like GTPase
MANEKMEVESAIEKQKAEIVEQKKRLEELEQQMIKTLVQEAGEGVEQWVAASKKFQEFATQFEQKAKQVLAEMAENKTPKRELREQFETEFDRAKQMNADLTVTLKISSETGIFGIKEPWSRSDEVDGTLV